MTSTTIGIIGLGYVGLPLSLQFARTGSTVLGFDIDPEKIKSLAAGESYILHITADSVRAQCEAGRFSATTDFSRVCECEAVIICVPTPLAKHREPDLTMC
jgi:UDP-N-acetyl-D-glucosamine dehydrogenase